MRTVPAASSVNRIASVAYATEDRLSLENTAKALGSLSALARFLVARERAPERRPACPREDTSDAVGRGDGRRPCRQDIVSDVAEPRRHGTVDADPAVSQVPARDRALAVSRGR